MGEPDAVAKASFFNPFAAVITRTLFPTAPGCCGLSQNAVSFHCSFSLFFDLDFIFLQAFTDHYYNTFDTNRQSLQSLYQDQSMLTFEGQKFMGPQQVSCRSPSSFAFLLYQLLFHLLFAHLHLNLLCILQIMQKLTTLPFQACQHRVSSLDAQPSVSGGILVFVTGQLLPEGETNPLKFSQTFHLMPVSGSFVVTNGKQVIEWKCSCRCKKKKKSQLFFLFSLLMNVFSFFLLLQICSA